MFRACYFPRGGKSKIKRGKRSDIYTRARCSLKAHDISAVSRTFLTDILAGNCTFSRDFCHASFACVFPAYADKCCGWFSLASAKQAASAQRSNRLSVFLGHFFGSSRRRRICTLKPYYALSLLWTHPAQVRNEKRPSGDFPPGGK